MKIAYQQFQSQFIRTCRRVARVRGVDFFTAGKLVWEELGKWADHHEKASYWMHAQVNAGKCVHLFVREESFLDWLVECSPTLNDGSPDAMREMAAGKICVFHFPTKSKYKCMACLYQDPCEENGNKTSLLITFTQAGGGPDDLLGCSIHYSNDDHTAMSCFAKTHGRLLNALGLYLSCFPEMLKRGAPDDVKHPSHHQYQESKTIEVSPQVMERGERGEVTAHFRIGHFRTLQSSRYTHKRFQVVFVKACFVNGEALTVLPPESPPSP